MNIDIGINSENRKAIAQGLSHLLADSYTLYLKTQSFHWNVTGAMFVSLHTLFEQQYVDLAGAVDEIAERIRALGFPTPGSYAQFLALTTIKEEPGVPKATVMIEQLIQGQEIVVNTAHKMVSLVESAGDQPTLDLLTRRMEIHEKNAWMLRVLLEK